MTVKYTKNNIKDYIKNAVGEEKYLQFMNDLSNISISQVELSEKYNISTGILRKWTDVLGYSHTAEIKQKLRNHYRIARRVKQRQETAIQIFNILKKHKNIV
jgi:hypothetical protein